MASSPFSHLPKINIPRSGGINNLGRILGLLQDSDPICSSDSLLVSIDLEVSRDERTKVLQSPDHRPHIKEYGIAILDPRDIRSFTDEQSLRQLVSTRHYSARPLKSPGRKKSGPIPLRECAFSSMKLVTQHKFPSIIEQSLRVQDTNATAATPQLCFRNIAIIGHSVKRDLRILQFLGIDIFSIAPLMVILDTHSMARDILGPTSTRLGVHTPIKTFTLAAVLTGLGCPHDEAELHNAGNDATYALFALIGLAIRSSQARRLSDTESRRLESLVRFAVPVG